MKIWLLIIMVGLVGILVQVILYFGVPELIQLMGPPSHSHSSSPPRLRFRSDGTFKILQIADMHYANGAITGCRDVLPSQKFSCSDLNTTTFITKLISAENPDFIVFSGDNVFYRHCWWLRRSLRAAFAPAIEAGIPWAAILGNHDSEGTDRGKVMLEIVKLNHTLARVYPHGNSRDPTLDLDGFGNYDLQVYGMSRRHSENKSLLNLYFLDSGEHSKDPQIKGYNWIRENQKQWFLRRSAELQKEYKEAEGLSLRESAPGLVYFHIPLLEVAQIPYNSIVGVWQEGVACSRTNSGFLQAMVDAGDVKAAFFGHDHVNDFCGTSMGLPLCYGGGIGYHAYGKAGWQRRARVALATLTKDGKHIKDIKTWKRLDDAKLTVIDAQTLWARPPHASNL